MQPTAAKSPVVAAFLQISDLHIARPGGVGDRNALNALAAIPGFDGLFGHDEFSLMRLEKFWRIVKNRIPEAKLVMTGDLTCTGHEQELDLGSLYLASEWMAPDGNFMGLRCPGWKDYGIPGNHDHWGGNLVLGPPSDQLWQTFRFCPYLTGPLQIPATGHQIVFAGINTDAGVGPYSGNRGLARGEFREELEELEKVMKLPEENEIRILLLHHSATWEGRTLGITPTCRKLLDEFTGRHAFSILLCGHTHVPRIEKLKIKHLAQYLMPPLHVCCGSSSRITTLPPGVRLAGQRISRLNTIANSVLLHELSAEPNGLRWSVETYFERPHGFAMHQDLDPGFSGSLFFPAGKGYPE